MTALFVVKPNLQNEIIANLITGFTDEVQVDLSLDLFWQKKKKYDLIHLHWPEDLIDRTSNYAEQLQQMEAQFSHWKQQGTKIVLTRHNYLPHRSFPLDQKLVRLCYSMADGIIHLGQYSKTQFLEQYDFPQIKHAVIPHPLYPKVQGSVPNGVSNTLPINSSDFVILVFGAIRSEEEQDLVLEAFQKANIPNKKLVITSGVYPFFKPAWRKNPIGRLRWTICAYWFRKKLARKGILFYSKYWDEGQLQSLFALSKLLLIPRQDTLNSGVLPLGFSHGKVTVGPATGNLKEVLETTGNPMFLPFNTSSMAQALEAGFQLAQNTEKGKENLAYAIANWNLEKIGKMHRGFYRKIVNGA